MQKRSKKALAVVLSAALCVGSLVAPSKAEAAKVKKIKLNKKKVTLYLGGKKADKKVKLKATITPKKAKKVKLKWTSSKKKIATVNKKGVVTAKKAGKTVITVKAGKKKAKCTIVVKKGAKPVASTAPQTTVAPTAPASAPAVSVAPTQAPTEAPTDVPSPTPDEGTPSPSPTPDEGTPSPSPTPDEGTPSPAPFETEVEATVDEDSTSYELDAEGEYKLTSSYGDGNNDIVLTDASVVLFKNVLSRFAETLKAETIEDAYDTFADSVYDYTYEAAKDVTVAVVKATGSNEATITVAGEGAPAKAAGTYSYKMVAAGDGSYDVSMTKDANNNFDCNVSQTTDGVYHISNVSILKNGSAVRAEQLADRTFDATVVTEDAVTTVDVVSEGFTSTMSYNEETGAASLSMTTAQGNTTTIAYDGETVTLDIPNVYVEKYDIKLFK